MKKIFLYSLIAMAAMVGFTSCNDDQDQLTDSRLTYYPKYEIQGDEVVAHPIGTPYTDAGCVATLDGEDYSSHIVTTGVEDVDYNTYGVYYVTYTAVNPDGYESSVTRTVAVCDPSITTDLTGDETDPATKEWLGWKVQPGSYRYWFSSGATVAFSDQQIAITKIAPGIFTISDMMGGYYAQRAGYGDNYAMGGYIRLDAENNLYALSGLVPGWGDSYDSFEGNYNPETGEITYDCEYAGSMNFHIILKK